MKGPPYYKPNTKTFKDDTMKRQITEAVKIKAIPTERSMNSRQEWNIARLPCNDNITLQEYH